MATLQELYDEVNANSDTIKLTADPEQPNQVSVTILYKSGGTGISMRRWIFFKDRGLGSEKAYWDGGKPAYLTSADSFPTDLVTELSTYQTANPTYEKYQIINTFASDKYALVKFYVKLTDTTTATKNMLFWKQGATWYVRELV